MFNIRNKWRNTLFAFAMGAMIAQGCQAQEIAVKNGEKVAFLGDSITAQGGSIPIGYVNLVMSGLAINGVNAVAIPAGIGGHKSNDMLARLDRDVLSKKPQWMTLSCGVNDVWHGKNGVPLEDYKKNITEIVDKCMAAGVKVMLLTSTMIGEDQTKPENQTLVAYNDFLKTLAAERKLPLADLNAMMQTQVAEMQKMPATPHTGNLLTVDGVHMNPAGNIMMATGVLKAFGLNEAQLKKANDSWLDIPKTVDLKPASVSMRQYSQLSALAAKQNRSVDDLLNEEMNKAITSLLKKG